MELRHLRARIERLRQLALRLGVERDPWLKCDAPVYLWEREAAVETAEPARHRGRPVDPGRLSTKSIRRFVQGRRRVEVR
jgi:hypothetical protein